MSKLDDIQKSLASMKSPAKKAAKKAAKPASNQAANPKAKTLVKQDKKKLPVSYNTDTAELTSKEELFCQHVLKGDNDSDAYRAAYNTGSMKPETVNRASHTLRKKYKITARIAYLRDLAAQAAVITESQVLQEAAKIAFSDIRKAFDSTGALLYPHQWPDEVAGSIKSIKVVEMAGGMEVNAEDGSVQSVPMYVKEVQFWDKNAALEKLFKHMGLYEKDNRQKADAFATAFARLPIEAQLLITEKLHAIAGPINRPIISGSSDTGAGRRTTH